MRKRINRFVLQNYFLFFVAYSVFGWCYEVFLEVVVYKWGFSDRGVLFGPYCPVYGVGAMAFLLLLEPLLRGKPLAKRLMLIPVIFLGSMISATAIELAASYICEFLMGSWPWQTYLDYKYNFHGRIALSPSIRFGLGGILFLYILQPFFEFVAARLSQRAKNVVTGVLAVVIGTDCLVFVAKLLLK